MADRDTLIALAERVEALDQLDLSVDIEIATALGLIPEDFERASMWGGADALFLA